MKKIVICILTLFLICISFTSCKPFWLHSENSPFENPNTQWMSEDGNIRIWSNEHGYTYGYINIDGEIIPVHFQAFWSIIRIYGYTSTGSIIQTEYEKWEVSSYKKDSFRAYVEITTFLNEGETILFHKLADDEKIDYEPLSFSSTKNDIHYENTIDKNADVFLPIMERCFDSDYDSHMVAIAFYYAGVKDIVSSEFVSEADDFLTLTATDAEGTVYYVFYYMKSHKVYTIHQDSPDGELIYYNDISKN